MKVELPRPDFARNMRLVGHTDVGGRPDGVQIMVNKGYAFISHMFSGGFSIVDISDKHNPKPVAHIPGPPNTWTLHLQAHGDLLVVINEKDIFADEAFKDERAFNRGSMANKLDLERDRGYSAGMQVYDIENPARPRLIGFMPVAGVGVHRIWYVGGRWAYMSAMLDGFTDFIFVIVDMANPAKPEIVGKYWLPGMNEAAGEKPSWDADSYRYSCHHGLVAGDTAYVVWRDGGLTLLDIVDKSKPKLIAHRNWAPPYGGGTHNALPLVDRDLLVVVDEATLVENANGVNRTWLFDIRLPSNPISIATFPTPSEADYIAKGGHFGPHNVYENRPEGFVSSELIFVTYNNAGVRAVDIRNPYQPVEVGAYVPPAPPRMVDHRLGMPRVVHSNDVFVDKELLLYLTDMNGGLSIIQFDPSGGNATG